jgi:cytidylate kinase
MDGRDIGTVVYPYAELKIWVTANMDVRTARRYKELIEMRAEITVDEVKQNIASRDYEDSHRTESPLKRAEDARDIDNSYLSKDETLNKAVAMAQETMVN